MADILQNVMDHAVAVARKAGEVRHPYKDPRWSNGSGSSEEPDPLEPTEGAEAETQFLNVFYTKCCSDVLDYILIW